MVPPARTACGFRCVHCSSYFCRSWQIRRYLVICPTGCPASEVDKNCDKINSLWREDCSSTHPDQPQCRTTRKYQGELGKLTYVSWFKPLENMRLPRQRTSFHLGKKGPFHATLYLSFCTTNGKLSVRKTPLVGNRTRHLLCKTSLGR